MCAERRIPRPAPAAAGEPFADAESAWFWTIQGRIAQLDGARVTAGQGLVQRPCEPIDVLAVIDRLYRRRRLLREHLEVLADFGRRRLAPDPHSRGERRAAHLWAEALDELTPPLRAKGIVADAPDPPAAEPARPDPKARAKASVEAPLETPVETGG